jgi:hypothetical protein
MEEDRRLLTELNSKSKYIYVSATGIMKSNSEILPRQKGIKYPRCIDGEGMP